MEQSIPLAIVARGIGGDVVSFAQFVRQLKGTIKTCIGLEDERMHGVMLARRFRKAGAVLDPYTAWVASEIGILPALKDWFKTLSTPLSTIVMIERMIEHEETGRGQEQVTMSFQEGQFYRTEVTDEYRDAQIKALSAVRDDIAAFCDVTPVLVPDETSDSTEIVLSMGGSHVLDAAFLASEKNMLLLSDDMHYRNWSAMVVGSEGAWIQAVLLAQVEAGKLTASKYAKAVAGLAIRAHDHIALTGVLLWLIARQDNDDFVGLRATLRFLAGPTADMRSHRAVFDQLLKWLWPPDEELRPLRTQAATGLALEGYLSGRKHDWAALLNEVIQRCRDHHLRAYLRDWLRGHFITAEAIENALPLSNSNRKKSRRKRRRTAA